MIKLQKSELSNYEEDLITYIILDDDEPIGSIELYETENPNLLVVDFIRIEDSLGSRTREVIRALKRIYPRVTRLKSLRVTGSHEDLSGDRGEDLLTEVRI